jgi:hypothetical protein
VTHGNVACSAVRHLANDDFSDSAWCQARARLPIQLIQNVHRQVVEQGRRRIVLHRNRALKHINLSYHILTFDPKSVKFCKEV